MSDADKGFGAMVVTSTSLIGAQHQEHPLVVFVGAMVDIIELVRSMWALACKYRREVRAHLERTVDLSSKLFTYRIKPRKVGI